MLNPWILSTEDYGEVISPDARVSSRVCGVNFEGTSARSIVLSVSPCHVPGCMGLSVDTGLKRTSLSAASIARLPFLKDIPTCPCDAGGRVDVCVDENQGFVSHPDFLCGYPASRVSFWTTCPSSVRILSTKLLLPYNDLNASEWLRSLEALVVDLGMSLCLVDIPHQSRRPSFPGQRLVCWHMHNSMSIF